MPFQFQLSDRAKSFAGALIAGTLFMLALVVLSLELHEYSISSIRAELSQIRKEQLFAAAFLTACSYFALSGFDVLALRYVGRSLSFFRTAITSFIAYTIVHNLGASFVTGSVVRYRLLSRWGFTPIELTQALVFNGAVFWLGFSAVGGAALLVFPPDVSQIPIVGALPVRVIGALLFFAALTMIVLWIRQRRHLRFKEWEFPSPRPSLLGAGVVLAGIDWTLAASVAYVLIPTNGLSFTTFLSFFLFSQISGLISHVPGGLGVFETLMVLLLAPYASHSAVISSLIVYRIVYYLVPLALGLLLFAAIEVRRKREQVLNFSGAIQSRTSAFMPPFLAFVLFGSGVMMLFSSTTPMAADRVDALTRLVPTPFLEVQHFVSGLAGMTLLILARGIQRRLDGAFVLTIIVLAISAVISSTRTFGVEEAAVLLLLLLLLLLSRKEFYREATLLSEPLSPMWLLAVVMVGVSMVWLMLFRYKHVEYSHDLWWEFSLASHAPRALRATAGAFSVAFLYGMLWLSSPAADPTGSAQEEELRRAQEIIRGSRWSSSSLALLGDKSLLFSQSGQSFIMYGVEGRSWISLGDPVGRSEEASELIWRFYEMSDRASGLCVFYEVGTDYLPSYIETGLELLKIGEEAIVDLEAFSLEGKSKASLRHSRNRASKEGWRVRIIPAQEVRPILGRLRQISDEWLAQKHTREKGFSLGCFDEQYLLRFPMALVEREGVISAFANVWPGDGKSELSVDLMRYGSLAPQGVMDFLFVEMMLWGKERGYRRFSLGMAPFSGFDQHQIAPLWNKIANVLYERGERLYNFQGLRQYKQKFGPVWEPRFIAGPGGIALARALTNVASIIAGGMKGVVSK